MKRILIIIAAIVCLCSCKENIYDGAWEPMELDKTHISFQPEGGQNTVSVMNYPRWWINGGYEVIRIDDQKINSDYIHASSSDGEEAYTYDILEGGWYHVMIPDKGKSNTIIITVDPIGDEGHPREAMIEMQAGNTFSNISIAQQ